MVHGGQSSLALVRLFSFIRTVVFVSGPLLAEQKIWMGHIPSVFENNNFWRSPNGTKSGNWVSPTAFQFMIDFFAQIIRNDKLMDFLSRSWNELLCAWISLRVQFFYNFCFLHFCKKSILCYLCWKVLAMRLIEKTLIS